MQKLKGTWLRIRNNWLAILLMGIIALLLMRECNHVPVILPGSDTYTTDTVYLDKPYIPVPIKPNNTPAKVKIYKQKDTELRDSLEKQPIIEKVEFKKNEVDITTVDTSGVIKTEIHKTEPDSKELVIGNTGQVEEKKKTRDGKIIKKVWKGTKTGLMIIGAGTLIILGAKYL